MIGNGRMFRRRVDVYTLEISRGRDVQVFLSEIGFSIREKQLGLPRRRQPKPSIPYSPFTTPFKYIKIF